MKCSEFIGMLFLARDAAHSAHLNTKSYSQHMALNTFYNDVIERADDFAETYQGRYGLIGPAALMAPKTQGDIEEFLQEQLKEIEDARYEVCDREDTALQQLIDNIVELYLRTIYKLKYLE